MRRAVILLIAAVLASAGTAIAAIDDYIGRPIVSVDLDLDGRPATDLELTDLVETTVGHPFSMVEARQTIAHLFSLGRFQDVRLDAGAAAGGVALRYELISIHHVDHIDFTGLTGAAGVDEGQLRRAVVDRYGVSPSIGRAADTAEVVADALRQAGYLHPTVTPRVDDRGTKRAALVFTIQPGARTLIGQVDVTGLPPGDIPALLDRLDLHRGRAYERGHLDDRIESYLDQRHGKGYYEAKIVPTIELTDADRVANVRLAVTLGPKVRIVFAGDPIPAERRAQLVGVEREGSVDQDVLEDADHAIEQYLRRQGYRDATSQYSTDERSGTLTLTFDVHHGPLYRVESVEVSGNASIPLATLGPMLRVRKDAPFSSTDLDADVTTIETMYRREGFAAVRADTAVDPQPEAGGLVRVAVRIAVKEGVRTTVGSVAIRGAGPVAEPAIRQVIRTQQGRPFYAPQLTADRDAIEAKLVDLGYPNVSVDVNPGLTSGGAVADVVFTINEGPRVFVDHILVAGNNRTKSSVIRRELQLKSGDPLSPSAVNETQRRLAELGLFRRTRITELKTGDQNKRDLLVTVEEAPATTLSYGLGVEGLTRVIESTSGSSAGSATQQFEVAPRASFSIGRQNLFGKNRSVELFTSAALYPKDYPYLGTQSEQTASQGGGYGFTEYRIVGTYREPRIFNTSTDVFVTGTAEQQISASFDFTRRALTFDAGKHLSRALSVSGSYDLQSVTLFNNYLQPADQRVVDRFFPQVLLSFFSGSVIHDTRDDPVDPTRGHYMSVNGQLAGRSIGSEVGFAKTYVTAEGFKRLPGSRRIVFAADARLGMATGFARPGVDAAGNPITIRDLPASERFFAGGDTSVRGFALDSLGIQHFPPQPATDTVINGFAIGGNGLVIVNAETRVNVHGGLGVVGFVDSGNVFANATDIQLGQLRTAAGFGLRYKSPIGPLRVDLGFNLHRQYLVAPTATTPGQLEQRSYLWISLGEAF